MGNSIGQKPLAQKVRHPCRGVTLEVLHLRYCVYSKYFVFQDYCGYICLPVFSSFRAAHALSILSVVRPSQYSLYIGLCTAHTLSILSVVGPSQYTHYRLASRTSILSVLLGLRVILEHLLLFSVHEVFFVPRAPKNIFF